MSFRNRWVISGKLVTRSPLRIGNGDTTERSALVNEQVGGPVQIGSVAIDKDRRACIPGSALKGRLRAWAKATGFADFDKVFGSEDPASEESFGGCAEFYDAAASRHLPSFIQEPPHWNPARMTGVSASVTIDRCTRTATDERLFHQEFVPPGVDFDVLISAQDIEEAALVDLLRALEAFNSGDVRLGSATGDGWGQLGWKLGALKRMTASDVRDWLAQSAPGVGYLAPTSLTTTEREALINRTGGAQPPSTNPASIQLNVTLQFDGHFLVNDPSRTGPVDEGKAAHFPVRDVDGHIVLPASSFRGALRSQAEKILRTLNGRGAACYPDKRGPQPACKAIYDTAEVRRLCLACQVFGAPGWRSPISLSDFRTKNPIYDDELVTQEFLAIDRFTGGGADGAKFNAKAAYRPALLGAIELDLAAFAHTRTGRWPLGLLALTLRDLIEGDIRFGFGSAKGYGSAQARISVARLPKWSDCPGVFKADLSEQLWQPTLLTEMSNEDLRTVVQFWVMELNELNSSVSPKE